MLWPLALGIGAAPPHWAGPFHGAHSQGDKPRPEDCKGPRGAPFQIPTNPMFARKPYVALWSNAITCCVPAHGQGYGHGHGLLRHGPAHNWATAMATAELCAYLVQSRRRLRPTLTCKGQEGGLDLIRVS